MKKIRLLRDIHSRKAGDTVEIDGETETSINFFDQDAICVLIKSDEGVNFEWVTYVITSDDDGHWYVIDSKECDNFNKWVEDTSNGEDSPYNFDDCRLPGAPSWVKILDFVRK